MDLWIFESWIFESWIFGSFVNTWSCYDIACSLLGGEYKHIMQLSLHSVFFLFCCFFCFSFFSVVNSLAAVGLLTRRRLSDDDPPAGDRPNHQPKEERYAGCQRRPAKESSMAVKTQESSLSCVNVSFSSESELMANCYSC